MHEYPIEGVQNGTLRAEKDGLYWKIDASCTRDWDHPIRLLAEKVGVACVPGTSFFNENVNNIVRVHFAKKDETLTDALNRLESLREKIPAKG